MLRCPDSDFETGRLRRSRRRVLLVVTVIALGLLASAGLSPIGVLMGALAGCLIVLFGLSTGWVVTHILKIPRDGRGVHERHTDPADEPIE